MTALIVIGSIFAISALTVAGLILYVKHKFNKFTKSTFGTSIPMDEAFSAIREGVNESSNSPRNISSLTSILLPSIEKDFPDFNYNEMRERAKNVILDYVQSISEEDATYLKDCSPDLKASLVNRIERNKDMGYHEYFKNPYIHRIEISKYDKPSGRRRIEFQASVQSYHYIVGRENKKIIKGSDKVYEQSKFEIDLIYIQDSDVVMGTSELGKALNCPNCGAPIKNLGAKSCTYCGSPIVEYNIKVWNFSRCEQSQSYLR